MEFYDSKVSWSRLLFCSVLLFLLETVACSSNDEARTPREFIESYSDAWRSKDVDTILRIRVRRKYPDLPLPADLKTTIEEWWYAVEKEEVERAIQKHEFSYTAWTKTEYAGEREHGDHIHVDVNVGGTRSTVVLVREGDLLKIHPHPSSFR